MSVKQFCTDNGYALFQDIPMDWHGVAAIWIGIGMVAFAISAPFVVHAWRWR